MQKNPAILVIFGISGDLSRRYLLPAIGELSSKGKLPKDFRIVGVTRKPNPKFESLLETVSKKSYLLKNAEIYTMNTEDQHNYALFKKHLEKIKNNFGKNTQVMFYLSLSPNISKKIIEFLGKEKINNSRTKLLIEKPFGVDFESAKKLSLVIGKYFNEKSIYRIDHYLAKNSAQELLNYRQSEQGQKIWSGKNIQYIDIQASEQIGIENRAHFYDTTGALKDMVQSHLLELLALTLMNLPKRNSKLPEARYQALKNISLDIKSVKRAQYEGYKKEVNNPLSNTETFVSIKLKSSSKNYYQTILSIETGKALESKFTEIKIALTEKNDGTIKQLSFKEDANVPYNSYERILFDAINSNKELFVSNKEVLETWRILKPLQKKWREGNSDIVIYRKGTALDVLK